MVKMRKQVAWLYEECHEDDVKHYVSNGWERAPEMSDQEDPQSDEKPTPPLIKALDQSELCPQCGGVLDYDPILKIWKCLWVKCGYVKREDNKEELKEDRKATPRTRKPREEGITSEADMKFVWKEWERLKREKRERGESDLDIMIRKVEGRISALLKYTTHSEFDRGYSEALDYILKELQVEKHLNET